LAIGEGATTSWGSALPGRIATPQSARINESDCDSGRKNGGDFAGDLRHGAFPRTLSALAPDHAKALKAFLGKAPTY